MQKKWKETAAATNACLARLLVVTVAISVLMESVQGALELYAISNTTPGADAVHPVLDPPTKLNVVQGRNKKIFVKWSMPAHNNYTGFRFKVIPLTVTAEGTQDFTVDDGNNNHELRGLSSGASYQLHAFTLLHGTESAIYSSCNFTVRPRSPTNLVFWFRNETTLLMIWQPPFPTGYYTHYKGLVPGRSYTVSVQTVSESEVSAPLTGQQRTVPARPRNLTIESNKLQERSFQISWLPPAGECEFEKYQISVTIAESGDLEGIGGRRLASKLIQRDQVPMTVFDDLQPGAHYTVNIKTLSGKVSSWPAATDVTLKPLPVRELQWCESKTRDAVKVQWQPGDGSTQDQYKVLYYGTGLLGQNGSSLNTTDTQVELTDLLPGCSYTVTVIALSRGEESKESTLSLKRPHSA